MVVKAGGHDALYIDMQHAAEAQIAHALSAVSRCAFTGRKLYRLDDLGISAATAQIARQIVPDLVIARLWVLLKQLLRHHHETRRTEAALKSAGFNERLLHRI